ncbi:MAG: hypothetical protein P1U68_16745 [Verrucomicrobiales bacterium]|nr:hypothetical protein [Verrucomicrobiales bacterium]
MMHTPRFIALALCCLIVTAVADEPAHRILDFDPVDEERSRTVPVKVYLPVSNAPLPVVLFSHGLGGSRETNPYLGSHWAAAGYLAVFIQHHGSDREVWADVEPAGRMAALKEAANFRSSIGRYKDIPFVIDTLEKWNRDTAHPLHGKVDLEHIGMSGHSYGANTTQAMMGQKFPLNLDFEEPRIDAFLAMSPSLHKKLTAEEAFGHIQKPVLLMTGTKDGSPIDPSTTPESRMQVFTGLPEGNKFHLVLDEAEHSAFSDAGGGFSRLNRIDHHHAAIQWISTRFWDAYLKNDETAAAELQSDAVRTAAGLIEGDLWEWK